MTPAAMSGPRVPIGVDLIQKDAGRILDRLAERQGCTRTQALELALYHA